MSSPIRLTAILTHPIQYYSPWFRHIATHCPEIALNVLYAIQPTADQQGIGFDKPFSWDIPLTEGYRSRVVRSPHKKDNVHSDHFWGLNVPEIQAAIHDTRPDVALIGGWHSITLLHALRTCRKLRIPILYRGDTHLGNAPNGWRGIIWRLKTGLLLRQFDIYLSAGRRSFEYLRRFGAPESRIFHVPHCVDNAFFAGVAASHQTEAGRTAVRAAFDFKCSDFVVLFVGKLEEKKRPLDIIRAVARLGPGAAVLIVGSGPLEDVCRAEAQRLGVKVGWAGFLNQSAIGRVYAAADCLVLPSDWGETWGLVVNEALATGLPCVVSDRVGCAPDLITSVETGEVFPMGDIDGLFAALQRIRRRLAVGYSFNTACRRRAAEYSYDTASSGLLAACKAAVSHRSESHSRQSRVLACCGGMVVVFGAERMMFESLRVLRERGTAVHCVVNEWENHRIVAQAEQIGATWSIGYYGYRLDRHTRDPIKLAKLVWAILRTSFGLLKDASRFGPTHILLPDLGTVLRNWPALAFLRLLGIKTLLNVQNAPCSTRFYKHFWRLGVAPVLDKLVCCSTHVSRELSGFGILQAKLSLIYNTAPQRRNLQASNIARNPSKLIFIGQIIPEKGLDLLLEAMALLVARGHQPSLDVVGDMDGWVASNYIGHRERLRARAAESDLASHVRFLGFREDVPALLATGGVHCIPSRPEMLEGLPLVVLEAKLAAIPSVAFSIGPFPELIVHGEDGWLCTDVNAPALADGLEYFLADPERVRRAGEAALSSAETFNRERFSEAWWQLFNSKG